MKRATSLSSAPAAAAILALLLAASCSLRESPPVVYAPAEPEPEPAPVAAAPVGPPPEIRRSMLLADMLYAARQAYDDNRLMLPPGDNAYDRYQAVLDFDPDNEVARRGMHDIALRYVQLADNAMTIGQYDNAASHLARAAGIGTAADEVQAARERLEEMRQTKVERFALDPRGLREQSEAVKSALGEISTMLMREEGATFLITAPNDAQGRWIYSVMREAAGGQRLRGNIAIGDPPAVQVQFPSS